MRATRIDQKHNESLVWLQRRWPLAVLLKNGHTLRLGVSEDSCQPQQMLMPWVSRGIGAAIKVRWE